MSVAWATADGTATSGSDYTGASGRLTFAPGQTQKTIPLTIAGDRTITAMRFNDLSETCDPSGRLSGGSDFGPSVFHIDSAGHFRAAGSWSGSEQDGDVEFTNWSATVSGAFTNATSVSGTITEMRELNYQGRHYRCTSGQISWSATRRS